MAAQGDEFHHAFEGALVLARKRLGQTHGIWINGHSVKSPAGTFATVLPSDTRIAAGRFQKATRGLVDKAVATAAQAGRFWREFGWQQRVAYLRKASELVSSHRHELAALVSLEVGKCQPDAMTEVEEAIETMLYYCQQTERHQGFAYRMNGAPREHNQCSLRPHGVWALVTAFNFPLSIPAGNAVAALAGGNTVVFKPSSRAPLMGARFNGLLHDAGLPVGVFNMLTGPGREVVKALATHPGINGLAFTGSTPVGLTLMRLAASPSPRPCLAAMSGNNAVIVMPSANLEAAAEGIVRSAFAANGQHCAGCSRVYAHRNVSKRLIPLILERTAALNVGNPLHPETAIGPLISAAAVAHYKAAVALGRKQGRLRFGGKTLTAGALAHGFYVQPAIFDQLPPDALLLRQERLLPVLGIVEVASLTDALTLANDDAHGRAAGIFTRVEEEQIEFFNRIEAASAYCNRRDGATTGGRPGVQSVGGWKASSSSGRNALGPFYVPQFLREQSQTLVP